MSEQRCLCCDSNQPLLPASKAGPLGGTVTDPIPRARKGGEGGRRCICRRWTTKAGRCLARLGGRRRQLAPMWTPAGGGGQRRLSGSVTASASGTSWMTSAWICRWGGARASLWFFLKETYVFNIDFESYETKSHVRIQLVFTGFIHIQVKLPLSNQPKQRSLYKRNDCNLP